MHFWDLRRFRYPWLESPEVSWLARDYLPSHWRMDAKDMPVLGTVHLQAEVDHAADPVGETAWLQSLRDDPGTGAPTVCVGYADLRAPSLGETLDRHAHYPLFRGIRQEAWYDPKSNRADLPTTNFLLDPNWIAGLRELERRGLSFDLMVWPHQLEQAADLFADLPELQVVLEHTGLPLVEDPEGMEVWRRGMARFAREIPWSVLKLSAMRFAGPQWTINKIAPVLRECIDLFGPSRCMFGSDYPVERMNSSYRDVWRAYDEVTAHFSDAERAQMFSATAARFYRVT
ncbi:amidohydrolase family protein [Phenylobacterium sp. LjRoot219]